MSIIGRFLAVAYEVAARLWGYNADAVPDWLVRNYRNVEYACTYLSSQALAFYQGLGYCV
jgi:hypothetical protein